MSTPQLDERSAEEAIAELSDQFAQRARALGEALIRWGEPETARSIVQAALGDDPHVTHALLVDIHQPKLDGVCIPGRDFFDVVVTNVKQELVCRLLPDMTPEQRQLYLLTVLEFGERPMHGGELKVAGEPVLTELDARGQVIPPGPLCDALRARGLVTCEMEPVAHGGGLKRMPGLPYKVCL
jgi:hypothetical protein